MAVIGHSAKPLTKEQSEHCISQCWTLQAPALSSVVVAPCCVAAFAPRLQSHRQQHSRQAPTQPRQKATQISAAAPP